MTMKCSERRQILQRVYTMVGQLISINEAASTQATQLTAAGVADVGDTVNKMLGAGGGSGDPDAEDTLTYEVIKVLDGTTADPTHGVIDWAYEAE